MSAVQLIGVAASLSLLAGWRLYACILAAGLAMHFGWLHPPGRIHALAVLANPWVIGVAALGAAAEFFADKLPWLDSLWDGVHTIVRPVGGALLALAIVDPHDPAWQVAVFLLGGGAALLAHTAKAGTRVLANASPEPFSNLALSAGEDVVSTGGLLLVLSHPSLAIAAAVVFVVFLTALLILALRLAGSLRRLIARGPVKDPAP